MELSKSAIRFKVWRLQWNSS